MPDTKDPLVEELTRLMYIESKGDWGPQPIICRWCRCWLEYSDDSNGRPKELHKTDCFAAKFLGRPALQAGQYWSAGKLVYKPKSKEP